MNHPLDFEQRLIRRLIKAGEVSPCEQFGCPSRKRCAEDRLACSAFVYFVCTGAVSDPKVRVPVEQIEAHGRYGSEWRTFFRGKEEELMCQPKATRELYLIAMRA